MIGRFVFLVFCVAACVTCGVPADVDRPAPEVAAVNPGGGVARYGLFQVQPASGFDADLLSNSGAVLASASFSFSSWEAGDSEHGAYPVELDARIVADGDEFRMGNTGGTLLFQLNGQTLGDSRPERAKELYGLLFPMMSEPGLQAAFQGMFVAGRDSTTELASDPGTHSYTRFTSGTYTHAYHKNFTGSPQWCQTQGGWDCIFCLCCCGVEAPPNGAKRVYDAPGPPDGPLDGGVCGNRLSHQPSPYLHVVW